jgi:glycosyltransferase involved in cell wall biosynthesis
MTAGPAAPAAPRDTVVVTAYGRTRYVGSAVRSVLRGLSPEERPEIVVVTDAVEGAVRADLVGLGAVLVRPEGSDLGAWIVAALQAARGDRIWFLDDDDLFAAGKLRLLRSVLDGDPSTLYLHHRHRPFLGDGDPPADPAARVPEGSTVRRWPIQALAGDPATVRRLWDAGVAFNSSSLVVDRRVVEAVRAPLAQTRGGFAALLFLGTLARGDGTLVDDPRILGWYRVHATNSSADREPVRRRRWSRQVRFAAVVVHDADLALAWGRAAGVAPSVLALLASRRERFALWQTIGTPATSRAACLRAAARYLRATPLRAWSHGADAIGAALLSACAPHRLARWLEATRPGTVRRES